MLRVPHPGQKLKAAHNTDAAKEDSASAKPDAEISGSKNDEAENQNKLLSPFGAAPEMGSLKSRDVCILLSLIPIAGISRMYLGYWKHAIIQFLLCFLLPILTITCVLYSLMTTYEGSEEAPVFIIAALALSPILFVGGWLWCYIESHIIKTDARGQSVMPGSFWRRVKYAALGYLGLLVISCIIAVCLIPYMDLNNRAGATSSHSVLQLISICILIVVILTMMIFGSIGIHKAKKDGFYLHGSVPDLLLSSFLTALFWLGFIAPIALDKTLVEKGNELSMYVTFFLGAALCCLSIWLTIRQIKKCNEPLTKWELFTAICGRLFIVTGIQILSVAVIAALTRLVRERNEVGGRAKIHPISFSDDEEKLMTTWGETGKKLRRFILAATFCIILGKKLYAKILDTCEDDEIDLPPSAYGLANLLMIVLAILCYAGIGGCINEYLPAVPHTARTATAPIEQPSDAITEQQATPEDVGSYDFTPDEEVVAPITTPQQEEPTATPAAEPVESDNPMLISTEEPQPAADTTPSAPQISVPTVDMPVQPEIVIPTPEPQTEQPVKAPSSVMGKRIRFIYTDTSYREGEYDGETCSWGTWRREDISKAEVWVGQAAPQELVFTSDNQAVAKTAQQEDGYKLVCSYQAGGADSAIMYRQLTFDLNEPGEESGEYVLSFETPTSGTAILRNCYGGENCFECENIQFVLEEVEDAAPSIAVPTSLEGKKIRFNYTDTRYRDGISRGGAFSWSAWQDRDLSQYSGWVALAAPPKLMFTQGNKGIYNPGDGSEDDYIGFILAGTYQAGQGNTASIRRELTYNPDTAGDASGEYVLTFDTPTSGTAELKNCARGESCFECENIKFVIEEISEEDLTPHTEDTSAEGGLSEAEKAELQDFLESLIMISSRSSSTTKLYQGRLLMLLPMIQEGAPVDVTTVETKGNTALHYACGMGRVDIVEWLVNHGADVNKQTDKGATPLDCVSGGYNAAEIRRILTQHGATKGKKGRR